MKLTTTNFLFHFTSLFRFRFGILVCKCDAWVLRTNNVTNVTKRYRYLKIFLFFYIIYYIFLVFFFFFLCLFLNFPFILNFNSFYTKREIIFGNMHCKFCLVLRIYGKKCILQENNFSESRWTLFSSFPMKYYVKFFLSSFFSFITISARLKIKFKNDCKYTQTNVYIYKTWWHMLYFVSLLDDSSK